jgi:signal transduction histidine kinase
MSKRKKYIPNSKNNPAIQAKKIEKLKYEIDLHGKNLETVIKSYDKHVELLSNFAQHDMKNAIQSMDSILYNAEPESIDEEAILSLKAYLKFLRGTVKNFAKLVPHSQNGEFKLSTLLVAVELLTRGDFAQYEIESIFEYEKDSEISINQPFQTILQMINNIVLNAIKAMENSKLKKIYIAGILENETCIIKIKDTGEEIKEQDTNKIFEYGFSTTGGTGIGLYHAKYVCEKISGNISVNLSSDNDCTKEFLLSFPINN